MNCCNRGLLWKNPHYYDSTPLTKLQINLKYFLDYALLSAGGWVDVVNPPSTTLKEVDLPGYSTGEVYQGIGSWVWENISYEDKNNIIRNPLTPTFSVSGTVNYNDGLLILDTPQSGANVTGTYSVKSVNVQIANDTKWWKEFEKNMWDTTTDFWTLDDCNNWIVGKHHKVWLPCIIIDGFSAGVSPEGLGLCRKIARYNLDLHIITETKCDRDKLSDLLIQQLGSCISMFDPDKVVLPLDCNGAVVNNKLYPQLIDESCWRSVRLITASVFGLTTLECGLYESVVRWECETVL